jgi:hypothetical protein
MILLVDLSGKLATLLFTSIYPVRSLILYSKTCLQEGGHVTAAATGQNECSMLNLYQNP